MAHIWSIEFGFISCIVIGVFSKGESWWEIYSSIEMVLMPTLNGTGNFINIPENEKEYIHIYFNESKDEIKNNEFVKDNKVSRIKIIID